MQWTFDSSSPPQPATIFSVASAKGAKIERAKSTAHPETGPSTSTRATLPPPSARPSHALRNHHAHPAIPAAPQAMSPSLVATGEPVGTNMQPLGTLTSLSPQLPSLSDGRSASPQKLKSAAASSRAPIPRRSNSMSTASLESRQRSFTDSPIDFYSRLDSRIAALAPRLAATPGSPLVGITATPANLIQGQHQVRACAVCFDRDPDVRFAARCPTAQCDHEVTICTTCLERHILVATHKSRSVDVRCPHAGCGKMLEYQDIYSSVRDWGQLV